MLEAIEALVTLLDQAKIRYCIIGGVAVLLYGGRASTIDLDFYLLTEDAEKTLKLLRGQGARVRPAGEFQFKAKFQGFPVDILLADEWVGIPALKRARQRKLLNRKVRIARPEDLILMKTLSDRPVDRRDIEELRELFEKKLDEKYISRRLAEIRELMK